MLPYLCEAGHVGPGMFDSSKPKANRGERPTLGPFPRPTRS